METSQHHPLASIGGGRGIMNNGNYSVTFMPLIAVMATIVPRFLSRIKQMRPTRTETGRGYEGLRDARYFFKEAIDNELCSDIGNSDYKNFPNNERIFYNCKFNTLVEDCMIKEPKKGTEKEDYEKYRLGRVRGKRGCALIQLHLCPSEEDVQPSPCQPPSPSLQPPPHSGD